MHGSDDGLDEKKVLVLTSKENHELEERMKTINPNSDSTRPMSLADELKQDLMDVKLKPLQTTKKSKMPQGEIWDMIKILYASKDLRDRLLASLLNALFTENKLVFLFSKKIMTDILKSDKNTKRNSANSDDYKQCAGFISSEIFKELLPCKKSEANGKRTAALVELIKPSLRHALILQSGKIESKIAKELAFSMDEHSKRSRVTDNVSDVVSEDVSDVVSEDVTGVVSEDVTGVVSDHVSEAVSEAVISNLNNPSEAKVDLKFKDNGFEDHIISEYSKISEAKKEDNIGLNNHVGSGSMVCSAKESYYTPSSAFVTTLASSFNVNNPMEGLMAAYEAGIQLTPGQMNAYKEMALDAVMETTIDSNVGQSLFKTAWKKVDLKELEMWLPQILNLDRARQVEAYWINEHIKSSYDINDQTDDFSED